jgi:hypothetical protein
VAQVFGDDGIELLNLWGLNDLGEGLAQDLAEMRRSAEVTNLSMFSPTLQDLPRGRDDDDPPRRAPGSEIRVRVILSAELVGGGRLLLAVDDSGQHWTLSPVRDVKLGDTGL